MSNTTLYSIIDLLPYDSDVHIKDYKFEIRVLSLCKFLYGILHESLVAFFIEKNLLKFDAHVGENSCQIRAIFLIELSLKYKNSNLDCVYEHIDRIKKKCALLEKVISEVSTDVYRRNFDKKFCRLDQYIADRNIYYKFTYDEYLICLMCFLTKLRGFDKNENIYIDYKSISVFPKEVIRRLVHIYQISISKYSVEYIKNISSTYYLYKELTLLECHDDDDRYVLPCYLVNKFILRRLAYLKIDIVFIIRDVVRDTFFYIFTYDSSKEKYVYLSMPASLQIIQQCYVVYLVVGVQHKYIKNSIKSLCIEDFINQQMAMHTQYSGVKLRALRYNPYRLSDSDIVQGEIQRAYINHRVNSRQPSTGREVYNLLKIWHVFADTASSQLGAVKMNTFYVDQMRQLWLNLPEISKIY